jgi:hypothetical protein
MTAAFSIQKSYGRKPREKISQLGAVRRQLLSGIKGDGPIICPSEF